MAKQRKLPWFRVYATTRGTLESIDSAKLGDALKAALKYFDDMGQEADTETAIIDPETRIAFATLKQGIDDSISEYEERREDGKRGAAAKKEKMRQELIEEMAQRYGGNEPHPRKPGGSWTE